MARQGALSRSTMASRFKQLVGISPKQYLTGWRMQKARELLEESDLPMTQIAAQVGYRSEVAFHHTFKRVMGATPGQVRRRGLHEDQ